MTQDDLYWQPDQRETLDQVAHRIQAFLDWLVQQPHEHVVVVTHGVFLEQLWRMYSPAVLQLPPLNGSSRQKFRRVHNLDVFQSECVSQYVSSGSTDHGRRQQFVKMQNSCRLTK
jgi:Histidine phosphatase superfamily (branch 1)